MKMIFNKLMMCAAITGLTSGYSNAGDHAKIVRLKTGKEMPIPTPAQSVDMRDAMHNAQEAESITHLLSEKTHEFIAYAEQRSNAARESLDGHIHHFEELLARGDHASIMAELTEKGDSLHALKTTVLSQDRKAAEHKRILKDIDFIERALRYAKHTYKINTITNKELSDVYILIYSYIDIPGSIVNAVFSRTTGGEHPPFDLTELGQNLGSAMERRTAKYEAAAQSNCPDRAVLGRTVKELFPHFTRTAFDRGMAVTNIVTGDKHPMTTVKLNGQWYKVYATDKQNQHESQSFTTTDFHDDVYDETGYNRRGYNQHGYNVHGWSRWGYYDQSWGSQDQQNLDADGYNRAGYREAAPQSWVFRNRQGYDVSGRDAQDNYNGVWDLNSRINQTVFYWPTSIRQIVEPYAFRFNQTANTTNSLLAENGQGYYDPQQMRHVQPQQSVAAKKLHRAITSPDNGVFWQRDTAFDNGQSNLCTYTSSSYTGAPRQGGYYGGYGANFERTDCTFVLEPTEAPTAKEFDARKNGFMQRVYAQRRAYYMRHQNLGHYHIDPQDDPVEAQKKMVGEFKERIARDRIYQLQDPEQRREDGRIYAPTPKRVYMSTRNVQEAVDPEAIELHNSFEANKRVYLHGAKVRNTGVHGEVLAEFDKEWAKGNSSESLAKERYHAMNHSGSASRADVASRASIGHAATTAAQRNAENALRLASEGAEESKDNS
ncbi:MAG: hypothetical protein V4482_01065 [Pseudomonadota bacterium]